MKLVVVSDLHADRSTLGIPRFDEVARAMTQAVNFAISVEADFFICLGDIADPDSGGATFRAIGLSIDSGLMLRKRGIDSIWLAGNHDVYEDGSGASCMTPLADVSRALGRHDDGAIIVAERPMLFVHDRHDVGFLCLPYVPLSHGYDPRKIATDSIASIRAVHRGMPIVTLGHLMIPGVVIGEETIELPRGRDVVFPIEETSESVLRMNGHYHQRQTTADGIVIPGSLCRFTFGHDEDAEPGFLYIEL